MVIYFFNGTKVSANKLPTKLFLIILNKNNYFLHKEIKAVFNGIIKAWYNAIKLLPLFFYSCGPTISKSPLQEAYRI